MKHAPNKSLLANALAGVSLALCSAPLWATPAGTLLFASGDMQIVNLAGISRPAKAGDLLEPGERVLAPDGVMCQIKLWDGSYLGVRPGSELKVDLPEQASERAQSVIQLIKGGVRVINVDLRDGLQRHPVTLQTTNGAVNFVNADAESRVVKDDDLAKAGVSDPGMYTRLQIGTGLVRTGAVETPIAIRTVAFTPQLTIAPTVITSASLSLFPTPTMASLSTTSLTGTISNTTLTSPSLTETTVFSPKLTTALAPTESQTLSPTISPTTSTLTAVISPTLSPSLTPITSTYVSPTLLTSVAALPSPETTLTPITTTSVINPVLVTTVIPVYTPPPTTTLTSPTITRTITGTSTVTTTTGTKLTLK